MTIWSGCWRGNRGMAWADDAKANAKATANNLIIVTLLLKSLTRFERGDLEPPLSRKIHWQTCIRPSSPLNRVSGVQARPLRVL
jgi:hypothetical protein